MWTTQGSGKSQPGMGPSSGEPQPEPLEGEAVVGETRAAQTEDAGAAAGGGRGGLRQRLSIPVYTP